MDIIIHTMWSILKSVILIAMFSYAGIVAYMLIMQGRFVYSPSRDVMLTPDEIGLVYESVMFTAWDGVALTGWYIPCEDSRATVLFCHGNAGNLANRLDNLEILHRLGVATFIFDYRGYGESGGTPSEKGTYLDAEAAWQWLKDEHGTPDDQIVILGRSLGGAVGSWLAKEHTPRALILESAFTSIPDMGVSLYPWLPNRLLSRFHYSTVEYICDVKCPLLVIHSPEDDLVPYKHGLKLFETAKEPKRFCEISGGHNRGFLLSGKRYEDGLDLFLTEYFGH